MSDKTKKTVRTVLQVVLGLAVSLPILLDATGLTPDQIPWLAIVVAGAAMFARAMQSDVVEAFLERFLGGRLTVTGAAAAAAGTSTSTSSTSSGQESALDGP